MMPYKLFNCYKGGRKFYCTKNLRTGQVVHYSSPEKRATGIRIKEAYSHGWKPRGLANASRATRTRVARKGGRSHKK